MREAAKSHFSPSTDLVQARQLVAWWLIGSYGYPQDEVRLVCRVFQSLEEQFETLRNFAEACCEIIEHSRNPVEEIAGRLDDVREIAYEGRDHAQV